MHTLQGQIDYMGAHREYEKATNLGQQQRREVFESIWCVFAFFEVFIKMLVCFESGLSSQH